MTLRSKMLLLKSQKIIDLEMLLTILGTGERLEKFYVQKKKSFRGKILFLIQLETNLFFITSIHL